MQQIGTNASNKVDAFLKHLALADADLVMGRAHDPSTLDQLERALGYALPDSYKAFLCSAGFAISRKVTLFGMTDHLSKHPSFLWAMQAARLADPRFKKSYIPLSRTDGFLRCINAEDFSVMEYDLDESTIRRTLAESFDEYLEDLLEQCIDGTRPTARSIGELLELLELDAPDELEEFHAGRIPDPLKDLVYRFEGPANTPPHIDWALSAMNRGVRFPPRHLVPIMPVDEASIACLVCSPSGQSWLPPDFGCIVRWHLADVPPRAQRRVLDVSLGEYGKTVRQDLDARADGKAQLLKIARNAEQVAASRKLRSFDSRPIRLAVQNVIVGLAAVRHDSNFDGLAVDAWQACEVPHVNAHEGARGLLAMTLTEAFRAGGTMEIRFDQHPEGGIPAVLRQFARVNNIELRDSKAISPAESRELLHAVAQMPEELRRLVDGAAADGVLTPERACFLLLSKVWRPIELEFILSVSSRAGFILSGGTDPLNRGAAQAEYDVCRSALMVGMLTERLASPEGHAQSTTVLEDSRIQVRWAVHPESGLVTLEPGSETPIPWIARALDPDEHPMLLSPGRRLIVIARPRFDKAPLPTASDLPSRNSAQVVAYLTPRDVVVPNDQSDVVFLACPDSVRDLDVAIETRLRSARVGRK